MTICDCYWAGSNPHVRRIAGCIKREDRESPRPLYISIVVTVALFAIVAGSETFSGSENRLLRFCLQ